MADRERAAGLLNVEANDYTVTPTVQNPGVAGADLVRLESAMGIVSSISVKPSFAGALFHYIAADSRACWVDVSPDATTWTRTGDGGGVRERTVFVPVPLPGVRYHWRLLCYYDQTAPWFSFPSDHSNLSTQGSFVVPRRLLPH